MIYDLLCGSYFRKCGLQFLSFKNIFSNSLRLSYTALIIFSSLPLTLPRSTPSSIPTQLSVPIGFYSWACGYLLEHSQQNGALTFKQQQQNTFPLLLLLSVVMGLHAHLHFIPDCVWLELCTLSQMLSS